MSIFFICSTILEILEILVVLCRPSWKYWKMKSPFSPGSWTYFKLKSPSFPESWKCGRRAGGRRASGYRGCVVLPWLFFRTLFLEKCHPLWTDVVFFIFQNMAPWAKPLRSAERVSKFCAYWQYQCPDIFDLRSNFQGKLWNIVPWPECKLEFVSDGGDDGDGDGDVPTTIPSGQT